MASKSGSLYVSGNPGTGKTASIMNVLETYIPKLENSGHDTIHVFLNCTTLTDAKQIYTKLLEEMEFTADELEDMRETENEKPEDTFIRLVTGQIEQEQDTAFLVILDEIDNLVSRNQEILYRLFGMADGGRTDSRLALVGIANALDLTDRILPRLQVRGCEPELLNFRPYKVPDIVAIIKDRLAGVKVETNSQGDGGQSANVVVQTGNDVIQSTAIEMCARKVAAASGDLRQALDVCLQALEVVCNTAKKSKSSSSSSSKDALPKVTVMHIVKVLAQVNGSTTDQKLKALNFQQKLVLTCFVIAEKEQQFQKITTNGVVKKSLTTNQLYQQYIELSSDASLPAISRSEFTDLLGVLEVNGILALEKQKSLLSRRSKTGANGGGGSGGQPVTLSVQLGEIHKAVDENPILKSLIDY
ncbi:AAA ATPase [Mycoemilia scoparia]|uniref:AAA ATPase n=1 Tax=Mycoemilia scoparia TaxID=417184 RepID=A0A9W8DRG0_9FUNG|nr:AAA ATPase [Mycoemilia scoparia]